MRLISKTISMIYINNHMYISIIYQYNIKNLHNNTYFYTIYVIYNTFDVDNERKWMYNVHDTNC